ncbi:MAG: 30S ribosomal protein S3 [Candidatus Ryanbacteria bacterium RIFCSPHIGHO2_02_FULL_48_12]|uniref:Small ribosomal subunit protein uS3 n=1 Tax=Candidatus Ryanbacteria bacterium RIFCSPHIGHO2_01_FULL_48_27 TaxID=1802115 RepID=A0A1G2G430_9BACT|nr:MAG: 30S ribosomal protein S3 [Candidatus Ryanbacteria bacterium RIFCSPHIGHO2_01_FULL_48_27]OGZ50769.1 MAG: 30S ribosomal protein S3 [Candidatus Ryanbacteria bacterium RIFCSPHIGHO2_02_FULL_48_12]
MTHIAHPYALRLGILNDWKSRWFDKRKYRDFLKIDTLLREWLAKELSSILVDSIEIERSPNILHVIIKTSQPGLLIGRGGEGAEKLKEKIKKFVMRHDEKKANAKLNIKLSIEEIRAPETHAHIVAKMVVQDLEKRIPFRRTLKTGIEKVMANKNVKGIKIALKGRLDGSEMARYEWLRKGRIPLQTLRADIDYGTETAFLPYGTIGIKVWIYKGEVFSDADKERNAGETA